MYNIVRRRDIALIDKKIYSAFISSNFEKLREERNIVIDNLLDFRILPIGMEHFTVSSNSDFSDIEELIDDSDFFIMLLGSHYGSCDDNGVSWTEREYRYAFKKNKPMLVIICKELAANLKKTAQELTTDELRQIEFCKEIKFTRMVTDEFTIKTIIVQFFNTYNFSKCTGWTRIEDISKDEAAFEKWRKEKSVFDLSGVWYHVHLSEDDEKYIRTGEIKIEQDFSPDNYHDLYIKGKNYSVRFYDTAREDFRQDEMKTTIFDGSYTLQDNGEIFGIFNARRTFKGGTYGSQTISQGTTRGIHDFTIDVFEEKTDRIFGEFHDEAPSPKLGKIFIFRNKEDRNEFLLSQRGDIIEQR